MLEEKISKQADETVAIDETVRVTEPEGTPESPVTESIESLLQQAYQKAESEGDDVDALANKSEEDLREYIKTSPEDESQPPKADKAKKSPAPPSEPPKPDKVPVDSTEYEKMKVEHTNLQTLQGRQAEELGRIRQENTNLQQALSQLQPVIETIQDPEVQQYLLNRGTSQQQLQQPAGLPQDYDPYNPAHIQAMIQRGVQEHLTQQERIRAEQARRQSAANMMATFQNNLVADQARFISSGEDQALVQTAVKELSQMFMEGKYVDAAIKLKKIDKLVAEAEQRGRELQKAEFAKQMDNAAKIPTRTAGSGSRATANANAASGGTPGSHTECETPEELMAYTDKLNIGSPRWMAAVAYGESKGWKQFMLAETGNKDY